MLDLDSTHGSLGILETHAWTPAMVALDAMEKAANCRLLQVELNDFLGTCIKIAGSPSDVQTAIAVGTKVADELKGDPKATIFARPCSSGLVGISSEPEYNQLIEQYVVKNPEPAGNQEETSMSEANNNPQILALGFIETQGFTAVFEAVDTACKAAQVEVVGKEKLGGGYVTIVIRGDVAAVRAAIDAATPRVEGLGKLIAAHVIARPSQSVLALLP